MQGFFFVYCFRKCVQVSFEDYTAIHLTTLFSQTKKAELLNNSAF